MSGDQKDFDARVASLDAASCTALFNEKTALIKRLKAENADKAVLSATQQQIASVKRRHRALGKVAKSKKAERTARGVQCYPKWCELPRSEDAPQFVQDFDPHREAEDGLKFFHDYGFVVWRGVLTPEQCTATRDEMWQYHEQKVPGFSRDDTRSWHLIKAAKTYGLPSEQAIFSPRILQNRQNPMVCAAFSAVLGVVRRDMLMSHDRWCIYLPTKGVAFESSTQQGSVNEEEAKEAREAAKEEKEEKEEKEGANKEAKEDRPQWKTQQNLHLDLNPWAYLTGDTMLEALRYEKLVDFITELNAAVAIDTATDTATDTGPAENIANRSVDELAQASGSGHVPPDHVQGVLNLLDNCCGEGGDDGGIQLVPRFQHCFTEWQRSLGPIRENVQAGGCNNWVVVRKQGGGSFKFTAGDPIHALSQRVPMRAGSLLVWDQRVVHGSRPNDSSTPRFAQFVRAFRRSTVRSEERAASRAAAVHALIERAGTLGELSALGRQLFGLAGDGNTTGSIVATPPAAGVE
jgi:hypothetical protein